MNRLYIAIFSVWLVCMAACTGKKTDNTSKEDNTARYAELLSISEEQGYVRVDVSTEKDGRPVATYLLVPRDKAVPSGLPKGEVIKVPVQSLVVNSSVYAGPLQELGAVGVIKGVTDAAYFSMPVIQQGLNDGNIQDVGNSQSPSVEKIVELGPDGILVNLYEGMNTGALPTVGAPYIKFADNLESTPLGRAEWIKFLGLLTGTESKADSIFKQVEAAYNSLATKVASVKKRPKVITDNMYEGIWYVPAGGSVAAKVIADAGGAYPWSDNTATGSLSLSYEEVLDKAGDADLWIIKNYGPLTFESLRAIDSRYEKMKPFADKNVWYSNTAESGIYDLVAFHPELLLSDYISIFHPELNIGIKPRFFQLLKEN